MIIISAQAFPPRLGGIQNLLAGTAEYIALAGHDVLVLADGGKEAAQWDEEQNHPYKIERYSGPRPLRRWQKARRIKKLAKKHGVKALYADTWKSVEILKGPFDFPILAWAHGNEFPKAETKAARIQKAFSKADMILFNSADTKRRAKPFTPKGMKSTIIHPPIFDPITDKDEARKEAAEIWGDADVKLLSMCRLIDWKGLDKAIEALPAILEKFPNAKWVSAGTGDDKARLEAIAKELNVADRIEFLGFVSEELKTSLLKSADLFLQPGRQVIEEREGYGISYVEAAYHALPTICGNAGGAPEAVINGETGLVIDATSSENVSNAILSVLEKPDRHEAMRKASKAHGEACLWRNKVGDLLRAAEL